MVEPPWAEGSSVECGTGIGFLSGDRRKGGDADRKLLRSRTRVESLPIHTPTDIYSRVMAADPREERGASEEIATSTLAEIYAQQGLLGRALAIYRRMQIRTPEDPTISDRIERLERRIAEAGTEPTGEPAQARESMPEPGAAASRERLPWDPPALEPEDASLSSEPAPPPAAPRVERLDSQAFAEWLEAR